MRKFKNHEKAIVKKLQAQIYLQKYTRGPLDHSISASVIGRMSQRIKRHLIGKPFHRCSYYLSISDRIPCTSPYLTSFSEPGFSPCVQQQL